MAGVLDAALTCDDQSESTASTSSTCTLEDTLTPAADWDVNRRGHTCGHPVAGFSRWPSRRLQHLSVIRNTAAWC